MQGVDYFLGTQQVYMLWGMVFNNSSNPPNKQQQDARASVQEDARNAAGCQRVHYFHSEPHMLSVLV